MALSGVEIPPLYWEEEWIMWDDEVPLDPLELHQSHLLVMIHFPFPIKTLSLILVSVIE
jgi:hypothetical protein